MGDILRHYTKWNKPDTERQYCMISYIRVSRVVKFIEMEIQWWFPGSGEGEVKHWKAIMRGAAK